MSQITPKSAKPIIENLGWKIIDNNKNGFDANDTVINKYGYTLYEPLAKCYHEREMKGRNIGHFNIFLMNLNMFIRSGQATFNSDGTGRKNVHYYNNGKMSGYEERYVERSEESACLYLKADQYHEFYFRYDVVNGALKLTEATFLERRPSRTMTGAIKKSELKGEIDPIFSSLSDVKSKLYIKAATSHVVNKIRSLFVN